jgi:hypothetical protein
MWCKLSTNFVVIDQYWCEVNDRTPIYVDWDFNSWFAQPNMPCPTRFEHEHIQTWLLLLNMRDDLHPIDTIRLLAVIKHYVDTWFLYIYDMVSRSHRWQRHSKGSLVKSITSLPSAVPTTKQRVRWLTADQHLITNFANRCNSHIRLVSIIAMAGSKEQTD